MLPLIDDCNRFTCILVRCLGELDTGLPLPLKATRFVHRYLAQAGIERCFSGVIEGADAPTKDSDPGSLRRKVAVFDIPRRRHGTAAAGRGKVSVAAPACSQVRRVPHFPVPRPCAWTSRCLR